MFLSRDEAREYMRTHATEYLKPDRVSERSGVIKGYVCPICGSGTHDKGTGITTKDGVHFTCWAGCFSHSDIIDIIGQKNGIDENDHARKFEEAAREFGIEIESEAEYPKRSVPKSEQVKTKMTEPKESQAKMEADYRDFFMRANKNLGRTSYHRGISLETLTKFQVGYVEQWRVSENAPYSPRLIIPTYKGGYLARDVRSKLTAEEKKYEKMRRGHVVIFNAEVLKTAQSPIFIVEGELDCLSIIDVGGEAIGLGSTVNVKRLLEILRKESPSQSLIIALDNDEAGRDATEKLVFGLEQLKFSFYRSKIPGEYKDVNEYLMKDRAGLSSWVSDCKKLVLSKMDIELEMKREEFEREAVAYSLNDFVSQLRASREGKEIPTGFSELDKILDGGLYPGLYVLGAISSLGKTTLALQIADQIAQSGRGVLIFSLEMSRNELIAKSLSRLTFITDMEKNGSSENAKTTRGILRGKFSGFENDVFLSALEEYGKYGKNIHISEGIGNIGVPEIVEKVREYMKFNNGEPPVVVIDYLQILAPADIRATDKQNTDKAVLELKRLSRDCEVPVIAVSSFNRENYYQPVSMASFKESGAIEYSSDVLIGLQYAGWDYRENEKEADRQKRLRELLEMMEQAGKSSEEAGGVDGRVIQLKILKHRNGRKGNVYLEFVAKYNYFKSTDRSENGCPF